MRPVNSVCRKGGWLGFEPLHWHPPSRKSSIVVLAVGSDNARFMKSTIATLCTTRTSIVERDGPYILFATSRRRVRANALLDRELPLASPCALSPTQSESSLRLHEPGLAQTVSAADLDSLLVQFLSLRLFEVEQRIGRCRAGHALQHALNFSLQDD
jgi:hypothetical protein